VTAESTQVWGPDDIRRAPLLVEVAIEFREHGAWPDGDRLQRVFARRGVDLDVWSELQRVGTQFAYLEAPGNHIGLTVRGLAASGECPDELDALVGAIKAFVTAYFDRDDSPGVANQPARVTADELMSLLGLSDAMVEKLRSILARFGRVTNGSGEEDGVPYWQVSESVYQFASVESVADLIAYLEESDRPVIPLQNSGLSFALGGAPALDLGAPSTEPWLAAEPSDPYSGDRLDERVRLRRLRRQEPGAFLVESLGDRGCERLASAVDNGVPTDGLIAAARWCQLETYLRQLLYIQLRALYGPEWQTVLNSRPAVYAERAKALEYMASADDEHLLSHVDVSALFDLISDHWGQCAHGIAMPKAVWDGKVAEVKPIRHRIAHCRRPHRDDVERLEQLLRDLEKGARRALSAYVRWYDPGRPRRSCR
jgi:hypothetical protein